MIKQFEIGNVKFTVKEVNEIDEGRTLGVFHYIPCEILIAKKCHGVQVNRQLKEQTLYHEVTHAILESMGKRDLCKDEEFVQGFSLLLHQFEKSKK